MAAGRTPLTQRARSGAAAPSPRSKFRSPGFPKLPSSRAPLSLNLSLGGAGGGTRRARPSGLGQASGSPEKGAIHSLPEGHNLGGSCCGREEPASSTRALPFNPSQPGPEAQTVRARPGPTAAPRALGLRSVPLLGSVAVQKIRGPLKKHRGLISASLRDSRAVPHSPPRNPRHCLHWAQSADEDEGGWSLEVQRDL